MHQPKPPKYYQVNRNRHHIPLSPLEKWYNKHFPWVLLVLVLAAVALFAEP